MGCKLRKSGTEPFSLLFGCQLATLGLLRQTPSYSLQEAEILAYPELSLWLARVLSVAVLFAASTAIGRGASLLAHRKLLVLNGAALVAGSAITLFFASALPLYLIGQTFIGIAHAWVLVCWAEFLASLATTDRTRCVARSALIAVVLFALVGLAPSPVKAALFMVVACGSVVGLLPFSHPSAAPSSVGSVGAEKTATGETLRGTLSHLPVELFALMASYAMLFRILVFFDFPVHDEALFFGCASLLRIGGMVLLLAYLSRMRFTPSVRQIIMPLLFLTVIGVALLPVSDEPMSSLAVAIVESSWTFFYTIMWLVLFELGSPRKRGPLLAFLSGWTVMNALLLAAAPLAALLKAQVSTGTLSLAALALVIVYMLSVALLMFRRKPGEHETGTRTVVEGGAGGVPSRDCRAFRTDQARDRRVRTARAGLQPARNRREARALAQHGEGACAQHLPQVRGGGKARPHRKGSRPARALCDWGVTAGSDTGTTTNAADDDRCAPPLHLQSFRSTLKDA